MPRLSIETRATFGLMLGGAIAGAAAGIFITPLGKLAAGAPPVYAWNAMCFAAIAAFVAPAITWTVLPRVLTSDRARSLRAPK